MARRLGALGVRNVAELIELDPTDSDIPLEGLQVSREQIWTWQAEGLLLCCVPDLTGRDVQVLVAAGIEDPLALQAADLDDLLRRVDLVRRERGEAAEYAWLGDEVGGFERASAQRWISAAGRSRTFEQALQLAGVRKPQGLNERRRRRRSERRRQMANAPRASSRRGDAATANHEGGALSLINTSSRTRPTAAPADNGLWTFHLRHESPLVDAPSIGPRTAERFEQLGIRTVAQFLTQPAAEIAARLGVRHLNDATIRSWQLQSGLMCEVPELRGHDAQLLVACGITTAEQLRQHTPETLLSTVGPFAASKEGRRLLRSSNAPDLEEVTEWIANAHRIRESSAA
jgi:hypothetical protein